MPTLPNALGLLVTSASVVAVPCSVLPVAGSPDLGGQEFAIGESITIFGSAVANPQNPSAKYDYYSLPFCGCDGHILWQPQSLGDILRGRRYVATPMNVTFTKDVARQEICTLQLSADRVNSFFRAISDGDDVILSIGSVVFSGKIGAVVDKGHVALYTSWLLNIFHDQKRIWGGNLESQSEEKIIFSRSDFPKEVAFHLSSSWKQVARHISQSHFSENASVERNFEWLSALNAFTLVMLLVALLVFLLTRKVRRDFQAYSTLEEEADADESGWKRLHADIFRLPRNRIWLSSIVGCGIQLNVLVLCVFLCALRSTALTVGDLPPPGIGVLLYSLLSFVSGYASGSVYRKLDGDMWSRNLLLTVAAVPAPTVLILCAMNAVASARAWLLPTPLATLFFGCALLLFVAFPLGLTGAILAKNTSSRLAAPTRTKVAAREIPSVTWLHCRKFHFFACGFLPFTAICVELLHLLHSCSNTAVKVTVAISLAKYCMLLITVSCVTVAAVYDQLSSEDHCWWWRAILNGGAPSVFVLCYTQYFFFAESSMSGWSQYAIFTGYAMIASYLLFAALASVGFCSSLWFVKQLYQGIKCD